jgi:hypothetical protein
LLPISTILNGSFAASLHHRFNPLIPLPLTKPSIHMLIIGGMVKAHPVAVQ